MNACSSCRTGNPADATECRVCGSTLDAETETDRVDTDDATSASGDADAASSAGPEPTSE